MPHPPNPNERFDGGAPCRPEFERAIANLTSHYQDQAVAFQGPPKLKNNIRWIGTEAGAAPEETWSCAASSQDYGAGCKCKGDCQSQRSSASASASTSSSSSSSSSSDRDHIQAIIEGAMSHR